MILLVVVVLVIIGVIYQKVNDSGYVWVFLLVGMFLIVLDYIVVWRLCIWANKQLVKALREVIKAKAQEQSAIRWLRVSVGAFSSYIRFAVPGAIV